MVIVGGRLGRERAGQPAERRPVDPGGGAGGRAVRHPAGPVHPHARGPDHPDRQPALRLALRVRARAPHGRPPRRPRPGQGAGRLQQHQRHDLPAGQPDGLRPVGRRPRDGGVGLRPLPALLQADGDLPGRRRCLAGRERAAGPGAGPGHLAAVRGLLRGRPAGRAPPDPRRQRVPPGGLRRLRPQRPPGPAAQRLAGLPPPGAGPTQPVGGDPGPHHQGPLPRHPRRRRRLRAQRPGPLDRRR